MRTSAAKQTPSMSALNGSTVKGSSCLHPCCTAGWLHSPRGQPRIPILFISSFSQLNLTRRKKANAQTVIQSMVQYRRGSRQAVARDVLRSGHAFWMSHASLARGEKWCLSVSRYRISNSKPDFNEQKVTRHMTYNYK